MSDFIDKLSSIQKIWHNSIGLLTAELAAFSALSLFLKQLEVPIFINMIICCIVAIIISLVWYFTNALPKTKPGKIGFVISIICDDEQTHNRIRDDFVITLRKLITSGKTGNCFQFIEIPRHKSCDIIDADDAQKLRVKTKAHFILYGRCRTRSISSKEINYIELDGLVTHKPISASVQQHLSGEFSELLPRKIEIDKENGLFEFEITSEWTELVAKYIIGITAEISGNLAYAEMLFIDVQSKLLNRNTNIPAYTKLKERIPFRLMEIREAKSQYYLGEWHRTHELEHIDALEVEISKSDNKLMTTQTCYLKAITLFLKSRDIDGAIKIIRSCPKSLRDAVWHMNLAFLEAYKGNLKRALQHYRNADKLMVEIITMNEVESFMEYILSIEPDKAQIYFCLGYINWKIKGDIVKAVDDYTMFINNADDTQFSEQINLAQKWISEMKN